MSCVTTIDSWLFTHFLNTMERACHVARQFFRGNIYDVLSSPAVHVWSTVSPGVIRRGVTGTCLHFGCQATPAGNSYLVRKVCCDIYRPRHKLHMNKVSFTCFILETGIPFIQFVLMEHYVIIMKTLRNSLLWTRTPTWGDDPG